MTDAMNSEKGMIIRLFHTRVRAGKTNELLDKFATTSADVVQHEQGNHGYFFGKGIAVNEHEVVFASFWESLDAVKACFGDDWQSSYLPPGYADLIETCSVQHFDLSDGWFVRPNSALP